MHSCPSCAAPLDEEGICTSCGALARGFFGGNRTPLDKHGVPVGATDREGNLVHPVFSTDEHDFTNCGTCAAQL